MYTLASGVKIHPSPHTGGDDVTTRKSSIYSDLAPLLFPHDVLTYKTQAVAPGRAASLTNNTHLSAIYHVCTLHV